MTKRTLAQQSLPAIITEQLQQLGSDIRIARKKRRLSMKNMAERMMVNLKTLQRLEKGDPAVGIGIVATALWVLGMHRRLGKLIAPESDMLGIQEDIKHLPRDFRKRKKQSDEYDF